MYKTSRLQSFELKECIKYFMNRTHIIVLIVFVFWLSSYIYLRNLPTLYCSNILLAPNSSEKNNSSVLKDQFGGPVFISGINLGINQEVNKSDIALETLKTRKFIYHFIEKRNLIPLLIDESKYTTKMKNVNEKKSEINSTNYNSAYFKLLNLMIVSVDYKTNLISISIEHNSPEIAKQLVTWIVEDINNYMSESEKAEASDSILMLSSLLKSNSNLVAQTFLYQMIEEKTKVLMFANIRKEYAFKVIDSANMPEFISKPKIILSSSLSAILGFLISIAIFMIKFSCNKVS